MIAGLACALPLGPALAETRPFDVWLEELRDDALKEGIGAETLSATLTGLAPIERVIELDRRQPEGRFTFQQYNQRVLSPSRIERGRELYREHRALLDRVAADYGVQPRFIVALWGLESSYGSYYGDYPVIGALATLAYDGRRASFFRGELLNALRIVDQGDIAIENMTGSWAGAMGQSQFMPSSYHAYAIDYDGDGQRDIWASLPDVFASIANYLARAGWNDDHTWGRKVRLPTGLSGELIGLDASRTLPEWQRLGVRRIDGTALPAVPLKASLLSTDDGQGPAYLVYDNFRVLMAWNRSTYFALTVGELAELIERP
ncbi:MAG TPA: lytic murein transglycosylase [Geminicoccaceae bacterium]|nr:lytic murein transglycosylase [Geminicoccaceae bacterium]